LPPGGNNDVTSTEHAINLKSLARTLHHEDARIAAETLIAHAYDDSQGPGPKYVSGLGRCGSTTKSEWPQRDAFITDTTFWNVLADGDTDPLRLGQAIKTGLQVSDDQDIKDGITYSGVKFMNVGRGVQWENTGSAVMAMAHFENQHPDVLNNDPELETLIQDKKAAYRSSIKEMLTRLGSMWGSVRSGGSDVCAPGQCWNYPESPHLAATAMSAMALIVQANDGDPVNETGNPYAVPPGVIPDSHTAAAGNKQCIRNAQR
jgi:hypothetical protein